MRKYILIHEGRAWLRVLASEGSCEQRVRNIAEKLLPDKALKIQASVVRVDLGSRHQVMK